MEIKELVLDKLKSHFSNVDFERTEFRDELTISFDKKFVFDAGAIQVMEKDWLKKLSQKGLVDMSFDGVRTKVRVEFTT